MRHHHHLLVTMDYPPVPGGIAVYLSRLWGHVRFERSVLMTGGSREFPGSAGYSTGYARLPAGTGRAVRFLRVALMLPLLIKTVTGRKSLVLHCGQVFVCGFPAALISVITGLRFVVYTYAADVYACQNRIIQRVLLRFILRRARMVVTISRYTQEILLRSGCPRERIALIAPGVDPACAVSVEAMETMRQRINRPGTRIILSVARLVRRKGHETILRALPKIITRNPDVVYVIAGEGPYRSELEALVDTLELRDRVRFLGHVTDDERGALYELCDIFALVPFEDRTRGEVEGFGIVYLEANSHGKPVIASRSGGIPDAVEDGVCGMLIPEQDEDAFADAANRLLGDNVSAAALGKSGKNRLAVFTWPQKGEQLESALRKRGLVS